MLTERGVRASGLRQWAGIAAVFALLLQALFALPLAFRMTADAMQLLGLDAPICSVTADGGVSHGQAPAPQMPTHQHAQCLICQAHALPVGLLVVAIALLATLSFRGPVLAWLAAGPPRFSVFCHSYRSRAPPLAA